MFQKQSNKIVKPDYYYFLSKVLSHKISILQLKINFDSYGDSYLFYSQEGFQDRHFPEIKTEKNSSCKNSSFPTQK